MLDSKSAKNRMRQPETQKLDKNSIKITFALLIPVSLGIMMIADSWRFFMLIGFGLGTRWLWKQYQQKKETQLTYLNQVFYQLIQTNNGRLTPLDLAMNAKVTGKIAQDYLEERVKEFSPHFEVTEQGSVVYYFERVSGISTRKENEDLLLEGKGEKLDLNSSLPTIIPEQNVVSTPNQVPTNLGVSSVKLPTFTTDTQEILPKKSPQLFPIQTSLTTHALETQIQEISYNQIELSQRLQVHPHTVSKWKLKPDFIEWSRQLDPEGISWVYSPDTKRFYPLRS